MIRTWGGSFRGRDQFSPALLCSAKNVPAERIAKLTRPLRPRHGGGAHAPYEYYVIESANAKVQRFDGAVMSFVEYSMELGK